MHGARPPYPCKTPSLSLLGNNTETSPKQDRDKTETRPKKDRDKTETRPRHDRDITKQHRDITETRPRQDQDTTETRPRHDRDILGEFFSGACTAPGRLIHVRPQAYRYWGKISPARPVQGSLKFQIQTAIVQSELPVVSISNLNKQQTARQNAPPNLDLFSCFFLRILPWDSLPNQHVGEYFWYPFPRCTFCTFPITL